MNLWRSSEGCVRPSVATIVVMVNMNQLIIDYVVILRQARLDAMPRAKRAGSFAEAPRRSNGVWIQIFGDVSVWAFRAQRKD